MCRIFVEIYKTFDEFNQFSSAILKALTFERRNNMDGLPLKEIFYRIAIIWRISAQIALN
jgi:hypothetical protein